MMHGWMSEDSLEELVPPSVRWVLEIELKLVTSTVPLSHLYLHYCVLFHNALVHRKGLLLILV